MATRPDPAPAALPPAAPRPLPADYDHRLRRHMLAVYDLMACGLLLTGLVGFGSAYFGLARQIFFSGTLPHWLVLLAPLGFVIAMNVDVETRRPATLHVLFWGFAISMGVSISTIFLIYEPLVILQAFAATAAGFAGLSLYGYTTRRDLTVPGTFLTMGVVGLLVAGAINVFVGSGLMGLLMSLGGVLLFAGLTTVDTQKAKDLYARVIGTPAEKRATAMAALTLYMDFINMFLFILRTASRAQPR